MKTRVFDIGNASLPGTGYPPLAAFQVPFTDKVSGAFFFGNGAAMGQKDWSGKTEDPVAVGTPEWDDGFVTLSGSGYLQTYVDETLAMTLVGCVRSQLTEQSCFVGGWAGEGNAGVALIRFASNDRIAGIAGKTDDTHFSAFAAGSLMDWQVVALQVFANGELRCRNLSAGTVGILAAGAPRELSASASPMRMGRSYTPSFIHPVGINSMLMYSDALSDAEVRAAGMIVRDYAQGSLEVPIPFVG